MQGIKQPSVRLAMVAALAAAALAQGPQGVHRARPVRGVIEKIEAESITLRVPPAGQGKGQAKPQAGLPDVLPRQAAEAQSVTIGLTKATGYGHLVDGAAEDLAVGALASAIGKMEGGPLAATAVATAKPSAGKGERQVRASMSMLLGTAVRVASKNRDQEAQVVTGEVIATQPLTLKVRTKEGDRDVVVNTRDETKYVKVATITKDDLEVGRMALVAPMREPKAPAGEQKQADAAAEPVRAAVVIMLPKLERKAAGGQAPVQ